MKFALIALIINFPLNTLAHQHKHNEAKEKHVDHKESNSHKHDQKKKVKKSDSKHDHKHDHKHDEKEDSSSH